MADADIGSLKSLHTLFDQYLDHMLMTFEQNCMVRTIQNFVLLKQKMINNFWQSVEAILEDVSVIRIIVWYYKVNLKTTIFQCSKNNGTPTRVARLEVAANMADPISLIENLPWP